MKWNAFVMARNEEENIHNVIASIKNQKPHPPEKIFVIQDGSTDGTGKILDDIGGLYVEHIAPHPPSLGPDFWIKQNKLMWRAEKDTDYILCLGGDTQIPESYAYDIIKRMKRDNVVAAHGFDKLDPFHTLVESGAIIETAWLRKYKVELPATNIIVCASVTGMRTAVYYDVEIHYMRKTGINHGVELYITRGKYWKALGHSLAFVLYQSIRLRNTNYLKGYQKAGSCEKTEFTEWIKKWELDIVRHKMFMKRRMSQRTQLANYVLPQNYDPHKSSKTYGIWKTAKNKST